MGVSFRSKVGQTHQWETQSELTSRPRLDGGNVGGFSVDTRKPVEACAGGNGSSFTITIRFPLDHHGHLATASCAGLLGCQAREADRLCPGCQTT